MSGIRALLNLDRWPDLEVASQGFAAKRRLDIAPRAFEINVNLPPSRETIEKIGEYAGKADSKTTKSLFKLCNGVRVGATKFGVFGVLRKIEREPGSLGGHSPLDINIPNVHERPQGWPEDVLIVAFSTEDRCEAKGVRHYHAITTDGRIIVAPENKPQAVVREYTSVDDWLVSEVDRALKDVNRY